MHEWNKTINKNAKPKSKNYTSASNAMTNTKSKTDKSSYFRVKLERIKFELYTEPDLTWTFTDLSLTASPLPSPV